MTARCQFQSHYQLLRKNEIGLGTFKVSLLINETCSFSVTNQNSVFPFVVMPPCLDNLAQEIQCQMCEKKKKSVKFFQPVMVWKCMSVTSVRRICFLKRSVDAAVYQKVQDHFLIPYVEYKF